MSPFSSTPPCSAPRHVEPLSTAEQLLALGWEIQANQYRLVHLAARFDDELEWLRQGVKSASQWIADRLQIRSATAREWIRVGHALRHLPLIDAALAAGEISYAKARILTRWADVDSEAQLLGLARERTADRLSVAIARALADGGETDDERDARLHEARSVTAWTDGDGMTVVRVVVPPSVGKPIVAAIDELVRRIAALPPEGSADAPTVPDGAPAGAVCEQKVVDDVTESGQNAPAGATGRQSVSAPPPKASRPMSAPTDSLVDTLNEIGLRWHPSGHDEWTFPSLAQQRADALVVLLLGAGVQVSTEVVFHIRGDGATFDDGTPTTDSAIFRQLDQAFVRLLIHDAERRPVNASSARRLPTTRQRRVVMETHGHQCVECHSTELLVLHHEPPYEQTGRTITDELEPRCAPCHRARHRTDSPRRQPLQRELVSAAVSWPGDQKLA